MILENIGIQKIISRSKLHTLSPIKFDTNFVKYIVLAAAYDLEWQEAYNVAKASNPAQI
jgi:hypothetical protein